MKNTKKEKPYIMTEKEAFAALRFGLRHIYDGLEFYYGPHEMLVKYRSVLDYNAVRVTIGYNKIEEKKLDIIFYCVCDEISKDCHPSIERSRPHE